MQQFAYSTTGLALTKSFEGLRLEAYQDVAGVWTIGYGHTAPNLLPGMKISQADADAMLRADVSVAVAHVNSCVTADIEQHHFDALVDFCFNVGCRNLSQSTLLRKLNLADVDGAAAQFVLWVNAGGKRVEGLARRREAERVMFIGSA